jgi:V/A-type H+/Na+-transporting ATPase subunit E
MYQEEKAEQKIQKICEYIRNETLDPARQQAKEIIENAHIQAEQIIKKAHIEQERLINEAEKKNQIQKKVLESSMALAVRQSIESLKHKIEDELFSKNLKDVILKTTKDPKIIANVINSIVQAIEKFGIDADISAYVSKDVDAKSVNAFLLSNIIDKLREKEIVLKDFEGGVKIKLHDMQITIDISDKAIKDLITEYVRTDFRELIYNI